MYHVITAAVISLIAAITDIKKGKIPNILILAGLIAGIILAFIEPIPAREHIIRGIFVVVIFWFGTLRLLGFGDIKLWMVMTVLIGPIVSSLIVAASSLLIVIYAVIRNGKQAAVTTMIAAADVAQNKKIRKEILEMDSRGYPLAAFMFPVTIIYLIIWMILYA